MVSSARIFLFFFFWEANSDLDEWLTSPWHFILNYKPQGKLLCCCASDGAVDTECVVGLTSLSYCTDIKKKKLNRLLMPVPGIKMLDSVPLCKYTVAYLLFFSLHFDLLMLFFTHATTTTVQSYHTGIISKISSKKTPQKQNHGVRYVYFMALRWLKAVGA